MFSAVWLLVTQWDWISWPPCGSVGGHVTSSTHGVINGSDRTLTFQCLIPGARPSLL